jgi:hypothetical protein
LIFFGYIQHELVPSLHAGDLVTMDNLRCNLIRKRNDTYVT